MLSWGLFTIACTKPELVEGFPTGARALEGRAAGYSKHKSLCASKGWTIRA